MTTTPTSTSTSNENKMKLTTRALLFLFLFAAACTGACAKAGPLPGDSVSTDGGVTLSPPRLSTTPHESRETTRVGGEALGPVESRLYPPELVMEHQSDLGITAEQKSLLLKETERGQTEMVRLQWDLQGEKEKLVKLLDGDHVDEAKVQAAASRVMEHEAKVKSSHLGMLVRVKNILTSEQIKSLREIRANANAAQSSPTPPLPSPTSLPSQPHSAGTGTGAPPAPRVPTPPGTGPGTGTGTGTGSAKPLQKTPKLGDPLKTDVF